MPDRADTQRLNEIRANLRSVDVESVSTADLEYASDLDFLLDRLEKAQESIMDLSDALRENAEREAQRLREALGRIADNAEAWHGADGHKSALAVIAKWARAALRGGDSDD